jgi:hypothetical protein
MAQRSSLDQIQTTIPPLIVQFLLEVCISRGLTILGPLSISVLGTSQLNQGYPMHTMHRPINDDKIRSLCLHHDVSRDRPATWGLQSIQVTVQLNCTLAHKSRLQATQDVIQDGIVPPDQPYLVQCVFTMDQNMEQRLLHHVPTELANDRSTLSLPSEVGEGGQRVYAAIHSKFQDTTRNVPHVGLPCDAFILSLR